MVEVLKNNQEVFDTPSVATDAFRKSNAASEDATPELIKPKKYLCFADAHKFAKSLNFKTRKEWRLYVKGGIMDRPPKPENIPAHPDGIYRLKGWQGWKFWLGTANQGLSQAPKSQQATH
jgi:hypothetical protein